MLMLLTLLVMRLWCCHGFLPGMPGYPQVPQVPSHEFDDSEEPLILTPYIEHGRIEEAQRLAEVHMPGLPHIQSYCGLLTVNEKYNSNLFFWYFPQKIISSWQPSNVIIFIQGFPGVSAIHGVFTEHGPFKIDTSNKVTEREHPLNDNRHVIYLDHALGSGFSRSNDSRGLLTSTQQVGEALFAATRQIATLFPKLKELEVSVMGEFVAAKYATALMYKVYFSRPTIFRNTSNVHLISPWLDPLNQIGFYHKHSYDVGLIDMNRVEVVKEFEMIIKWHLKMNNWGMAYDLFKLMINSVPEYKEGMVDFAHGDPVVITRRYCEWLWSAEGRGTLHMGGRWYAAGRAAGAALAADAMRSSAPWLRTLVRHGQSVTFHTGTLAAYVPASQMSHLMGKVDDKMNYILGSQYVVLLPTYERLAQQRVALYSLSTIVIQMKVGNYLFCEQNYQNTMMILEMYLDKHPINITSGYVVQSSPANDTLQLTYLNFNDIKFGVE